MKNAPAVDFVSRNEFDFTIKEVADDNAWAEHRGPELSQQRGRRSSTTPIGRSWRTWTRLPLVTPDLQARPEDRELLHRLSEAPLPVDLHRPGLQIALHLLPVAADRRRPPLPHPQRRARDRGDRLGPEGLPAGEGVLLRRRHLHRRPAARRGHRQGAGQAGRHLVVQRQGQCAARDAEDPEGRRPAPAAGRLRESGDQQILYNIKKGMRVEVAEQFTKDCHELGIAIHGTFILGLPGETPRDHPADGEWAAKINPHTIQVSLAAPYPGTFLYDQAVENGWLDAEQRRAGRRQRAADRAPALSAPEPRADLRFGGDLLQALLPAPARRSARSSARWSAAPT